MRIPRLVSAGLMIATSLGLATVLTGTPAHADSSPGGQITRSEVLARAQNWVDRGVKYNLTRASSTLYTDVEGDNRYGPDCSGLVSMAWHITANAKQGRPQHERLRELVGQGLPGQPARPQARRRDPQGRPHRAVRPLEEQRRPHPGRLDLLAERHRRPRRERLADGLGQGPGGQLHGQRGDESWSSMQNYRPIRYKNIVDDSSPPAPRFHPGDYDGDGKSDRVLVGPVDRQVVRRVQRQRREERDHPGARAATSPSPATTTATSRPTACCSAPPPAPGTSPTPPPASRCSSRTGASTATSRSPATTTATASPTAPSGSPPPASGSSSSAATA